MMRLSMMARETPTASIDSVIALAHELKLDGVDIHMSGMPREEDYLLRVKLLCLKYGLSIGYAGGGSFVGPPTGPSKATLRCGKPADMPSGLLHISKIASTG